MVLVKRRNYGSANAENVATFPLTVDSAVLGHQQVGPAGHLDATMLRTRAALSLTVAVGASPADIPPEIWFEQAAVTLYAYWHPTTFSGPDPASGTQVGYLGSVQCQKRLVASPSAPAEYYVNFFTDDDLVTDTSRKSNSITTVPCVNWWIYAHDPQFCIQGGFTATSVSYELRYYVLWGSPT